MPFGSNLNGEEAAVASLLQPEAASPHPSEDLSSLYNEAYYRTGLGNIPYERSDYWLSFFAGVAEQIARSLSPRKVLDAGCAMGFLVESFWARGIEAWGIDISPYAISKVRQDIASYCRQASLTEPITGTYDLVTCIEVLEHIPPEDTAQVLRNLTSVTDTILFSSTPTDFEEVTHINVRPPLYWLRAFAEYGFQPDLLFDTGFLTPHGFLLRRGPALPEDSVMLLSRLVLYRCVLAEKDNACQVLTRHNTEMRQQIEGLTAHRHKLETQIMALQEQSDSLLNGREATSDEQQAGSRLAGLNQHLVGLHRHLAGLNNHRSELHHGVLPNLAGSDEQAAAGLDQQISDLTHHIAGLDQQINAFTHHIAGLDQQINAFTHHIAGLEEQNTALTRHAGGLEEQNAALSQHIAGLDAQHAQLSHHAAGLQEQNTAFARHIAGLEEQNAALTLQIAGLKEQNIALSQQIAGLKEQNAALSQQIAELDAQHAGLTRHTAGLDELIGALTQHTGGLEEQNTALSQRVAELREQNASALQQVLQLTRDRNALAVQLRDVSESPGWQFIQHYRRWLDHNVQSRPWLRKSYEPIVWWFLRHFSAQRGKTVQPAPPAAANSGSSLNEAAAPLPAAQPAIQPTAPAPLPPTPPPADPASTPTEAQPAVPQRMTYEQWIAGNEPDTSALEAQRKKAREMVYRPLISVVLPVYRIGLPVLQSCVRSVLDQTYDQWELCIAHADPEAADHRAFLTELAAADPRVKLVLLNQNGGISANSNHALDLATGEFVALLDHDDTLAPFALYEVANLLGVNPDLDLIYSDHDYIDKLDTHRFNPLFKPDWSPEIMLSANYITHLTVLRRSMVTEVGGFEPSTDGAQDWDLFFKVTERTTRIGHIPQILYHWRTHASSTALNTAAKNYAQTAQLRALQAHLDRQAIPAQAEVKPNGLLHLRWLLPSKATRKVSIIIPSKDKVDLLSRCIETLRKVTAYDNLEILVVDNGSTEPATQRYYESLRNTPGVQLLDYPHAFNYSAMNNVGAKSATGELLLFLNNDMEIIAPDWLSELASWMEIPAIGVVGARLLRPDGTIQHAGVVLGFDGFAGHPFADQPAQTFNIFGSTGWYRNYLAVTGACLMMRRQVFDEIGGFDEDFISCGSDVEICLRASQRGYRTVYTPFAELVHYECQTRKGDVPSSDFLVSFQHYHPYLLNGDPYWNPNLSPWDKTMGFRDPAEPSSLVFVQDFLRKLKDYSAAGKPAAAPKPAPITEAKEENLFVSWFDHTTADLRASRDLMASIQGNRPVRKMIWFIPPFEHAFYGGIFTILRFADGWARAEGVSHHFAICGSASREQMAERIRNIHPACTAASVTILSAPADVGDLPEADVCVATLWTTAYYALKFRKAPRKFYFIQDYEPGFYRAGSASALVENTYRFGFYGIANTVSLKEVYEREYNARAAYFSPCVDLSVFHPPASALLATAQKWRLFCYARPQHARNAFELLAAALRILKSRLGRNVQILCAGSEWEPRDHGLENVAENLGLMEYEQTAELYRTCHAGAVLMLTRHPSYIPLELMASGCLVITNRSHWTEWLLQDEENCLLSNTSATCLAETIERGLTDHALRRRITSTASELVRNQYANWDREIERTYQFLCDPEGSPPLVG